MSAQEELDKGIRWWVEDLEEALHSKECLAHLRGESATGARNVLYRAVNRDRVRLEDQPSIYAEALRKAAENALRWAIQMKLTPTVMERLPYTLALLDSVIERITAAEEKVKQERAEKAQAKREAWPEDQKRQAQIQRWLTTLTIGLDICDNLGEPSVTPTFDHTPETLAAALRVVFDAQTEQSAFRADLGLLIDALIREDTSRSFIHAYDIADKFKRGEWKVP